jgi:transketolase
MELFEAQPQDYRDAVLPPTVTARLAVEAGVAMPWHKWIGSGGDCLCMSGYGASAPANVLFEKFGFTPANIIAKSKSLLAASNPVTILSSPKTKRRSARPNAKAKRKASVRKK